MICSGFCELHVLNTSKTISLHHSKADHQNAGWLEVLMSFQQAKKSDVSDEYIIAD